MIKKKILVGCEESQTVTKAFRDMGHEAYSCDLQECSGGYPEWHIQGDVFDAIEKLKPDMGIIHPPCTYLTVTGNKWLKDQPERASGTLVGQARREAELFFIKLWNCNIPRLCLENPIGSINSIIKPTQIIQPYYFGDEAQKTTCLWLKNLPPLYHNKEVNLFDTTITHVGRGEMMQWIDKKTGKNKSMPHWYGYAEKKDRSKTRSKTFPGIALAMSQQWSFE